MEAWLRQNPPARQQYREGRRAQPTGCIVVHTAESILDVDGADGGAEAVANFIRKRTTAGSYHDIVDSDSDLKLVRYSDEAYQDGTGSNPFALSISFACKTSDWATMPKPKRAAMLRQGAKAFKRQQEWLAKNNLPLTPLKRITKAESDAGKPGFIAHGKRDPGRRSDPGADFPWDEWYAACHATMSGQPYVPAPAPAEPTIQTPAGGRTMVIVLDPDGRRQWLCTHEVRRHLNGAESRIYRAGGVVLVGPKQATEAERREMLTRLTDITPPDDYRSAL